MPQGRDNSCRGPCDPSASGSIAMVAGGHGTAAAGTVPFAKWYGTIPEITVCKSLASENPEHEDGREADELHIGLGSRSLPVR
jgi:hypothetical protein